MSNDTLRLYFYETFERAMVKTEVFHKHTSQILICVLCFTFSIVPCMAEVKSGFWQLTNESASRTETDIDFSELSSTCPNPVRPGNDCLKTPDLSFWHNQLNTPFGGLHDSSLSAQIMAYFSSNQMYMERTLQFYLDSILKKIQLRAPTSGYADSLELDKDVYFIRTSEGKYAVLIKTGTYIGGYNRNMFYWAYQPDTGKALHKERFYPQPEQISITVDIQLGNANPDFQLSDPAAISALTRQIYISINPYFDTSIVLNQLPRPENPGYRSVLIRGPIDPDNLFEDDLFFVSASSGGISAAKNNSAAAFMFEDRGAILEKTIIGIGCQQHLISIEETGEVSFCDVVPDSLKPVPVPIGKPQTHLFFRPVQLISTASGIFTYRVNMTGELKMALYTTDGKHIAHLVNQHRKKGGHYSIHIKNKSISPGHYLLHGTTAGDGFSFPVLIEN